jgi:plastocyanin
MTTHSVRLAVASLAVVIAVAAFSTSALARTQGTPTLYGTVGKNDAYKIMLLSSSGKLVKTLKAGTYNVVIHDDSALHNYELDGPHGKSWTFTSVGFKGAKTFKLKLVAGKYKAYCAPHESMMFQHFTVS